MSWLAKNTHLPYICQPRSTNSDQRFPHMANILPFSCQIFRIGSPGYIGSLRENVFYSNQFQTIQL